MTKYDAKAVEKKWQKKWEEDKIFYVRADKTRPKYFANSPYPYVNGFLHIGQGVTYLHPDIMCRYKRMKGFNVLWPFAFHCTGMPIVAAAKRIAEKEPKQIEFMISTGIPEKEIPKFADENYWTEFFPAEDKADLQRFGLSTDWSRSFKTTRINPHYDRFVKWQFNLLREMGYVRLGEHPVIWCPRDKTPVGDHDRVKGEGETPSEFTLLKFKYKDSYLVAATLRPETVYGQTNIWLDPDVEYVEVDVDGERWIINRECSEKLAEQKRSVQFISKVRGADLIGEYVLAPAIHRKIIVLPTKFIDQSRGTGIVTSVPSDAPDDWVALLVLRENEEECKKYGLDLAEIKSIEPIPIIDTKGRGDLPAVEIVERMDIKSLDEREKLNKAKEEVYRAGFYDGVMKSICGEFAGMPVVRAKEEVKDKLLDEGEASIMYEPSGEVVCRCLTPAIVKIVDDQWFLAYGDNQWKLKVHKCLDEMTIYPEVARKQFNYVIDWLQDWACTHHFGLGTRLPWDDKWIIESLSDSTIYMAFYTISHILHGIDAEKVTEDVFDFIFRDVGTSSEVAEKTGIPEELLMEMKNEFEYWYPFDLRHSGKDLIQNHLCFTLFNHVAIFDKKYWPKAFGLNGYITVKQVKMSKSLGNVRTLRDSLRQFGADVTRLTLAQGGEGLDDPSFDPEFALSIGKKLEQWFEYATTNHESREDWRPIDSWFRSTLNRTVRECEEAMEVMNHRTALKVGYFDLQRDWSWYLRRTSNLPNKDILHEFIDIQTRLLAPFAPFICEEIWERMGKEGYISLAPYPECKEEDIDSVAERSENLLKNVLDDIREIVKVTKLTPKRIVLYVAPEWKRKIYEMAINLSGVGKLDMKSIMEKVVSDPSISGKRKEAGKFLSRILKDIKRMSKKDYDKYGSLIDELSYLQDSKEFLASEFACHVDLFDADDPNRYDPKSKAVSSQPWRPAIYIE